MNYLTHLHFFIVFTHTFINFLLIFAFAGQHASLPFAHLQLLALLAILISCLYRKPSIKIFFHAFAKTQSTKPSAEYWGNHFHKG